MYKLTFVTLLAICALFLLPVEVTSNKIVLRQLKGSFSSPVLPNQAINYEFVIRAKKNRKISLRIDELDLNSENSDSVMIRDGHKSTVYYIYTKQNDNIHLTVEDEAASGSESSVVEEPVLFHANTRRLFVIYYTQNSADRAGFTASYETYPSGLCQISSLHVSDVSPSCDRYDIAPVATRCSHNISCPENYEQTGQAVCINGGWEDRTKCLPNATLVEQCQLELDDLSNCSFTPQQLIDYYFELAQSHEIFEQPLIAGRSFAKRNPCPDVICQRSGNKFVLHCKNTFGANMNIVRLCLICQFQICPRPDRELNVFATG